mmetsp:Transcript_9159/g.21528  ORF Transcript_9159/g.21528 Transcript_9159/m.21528 type:complete len:206 (+) Transcript_9159:128-745(+)
MLHGRAIVRSSLIIGTCVHLPIIFSILSHSQYSHKGNAPDDDDHERERYCSLAGIFRRLRLTPTEHTGPGLEGGRFELAVRTFESILAKAAGVRIIWTDNAHANTSIDTKAMRVPRGVRSIALGAHILRLHIVFAIEAGDGLALDSGSRTIALVHSLALLNAGTTVSADVLHAATNFHRYRAVHPGPSLGARAMLKIEMGLLLKG